MNNNLYPQTNPGCSFDDYDSIIDGFSISGRTADSDDVSSMHMSEMGGASVAVGGVSPASSPARNNGVLGGGGQGGINQFNAAQLTPATLAARAAEGAVPPRGTDAAVILAAARNNGVNLGSPQCSTTSANENDDTSLHLGSDASSGYYDVGDLGIDATDVSAILGPDGACADPLDGESLLAQASDLMPSVTAVRNHAAFSDTKLLERDDAIWGKGRNAQNNKDIRSESRSMEGNRHTQLGPLGDELSYAAGNDTYNENFSGNYKEQFGYPLEDDESEEGEDDEGLLPNWISSSSRRVKFVFVVSTALILGSLVMAIVVLGISYITGSTNSGGSSGSASSVSVDRVGSFPGSVPHDDNSGSDVVSGNPNDAQEMIPGETITAAPAKYPTFLPTATAVLETNAPVLSTTGEEEEAVFDPSSAIFILTTIPASASTTTATPTSQSPSTISPTKTIPYLPTMANTATSDILDLISSAITSPPTKSPRQVTSSAVTEVANIVPTSSPTTNMPTSPSMTVSPTVGPSSSNPTISPSSEPTSSHPTPSPSSSPVTANPSLTASNQPSSSPNPTILAVTTGVPTETAAPTISIARSVPSVHPTVTFRPTSLPSKNPRNRISLVPTSSIQPTWSFGGGATEEGDASFYLMADGGSNRNFWTDKLGGLNESTHKFMVHLGSATRVIDYCDSIAYYRTESSLSVSPVPVYSIPGNNDWAECANPASAWQYYESHMMGLDIKYWNAAVDYDVKRQVDRTENFAFLYKKVMFVGLHMVTNSDANETMARLEDNIEWVVSNVDKYWKNIDAIFVMGYSRLLAEENAPFYDAMVTKKQTEWNDKLLVYARRASDSGMTRNVGGVENFVELKVGNEWPIMDVRVRTGGGWMAKLDYRDVMELNDDDEEAA